MKKTLLIILTIVASNANAALITLNATNSGWYNTNLDSNGSTSYMQAGTEESGTSFRNWIAFDLSGITETISSASLHIYNDIQNSSSLSNFTWSEITTTTPELFSISTNLVANFNIYNDLGDGTVYASGSTTHDSVDYYSLTAEALTSLNNATGLWTTGGSTTDSGLAYGFVGGVTSGFDIQLKLELPDPPVAVPAPAAIWLFGSGLLTLMGLVRKKRAS